MGPKPLPQAADSRPRPADSNATSGNMFMMTYCFRGFQSPKLLQNPSKPSEIRNVALVGLCSGRGYVVLTCLSLSRRCYSKVVRASRTDGPVPPTVALTTRGTYAPFSVMHAFPIRKAINVAYAHVLTVGWNSESSLGISIP